MKIGEVISLHRKQLGMTQEQLGEAVGVSGQAVSKWENGGVPDAFLLPDIARTLGISIDRLFDVEKKTSDMSEEEFFDFLFHSVWDMQTSYLSPEERKPLEAVIEKYAGNPQVTSQIINDQGTTYFSLVKGFPFFCAVKDSPEISPKLLSEPDFGEFFGLLADEEGRKAVIFTQSITETSQYTAEAMAANMGIEPEKFNTILPLLVKYSLLSEASLMLNGEKMLVYHKMNNPEIRPILMMAYQFIHARQCYYNFTSHRTKPYF